VQVIRFIPVPFVVLTLILSGCASTAVERATYPSPDGKADSGASAFADAGTSVLAQRNLVEASLFSSHLCGALMIDGATAVTARHCVTNRKAADLAIVTGVVDLCEEGSPEIIPVKRLHFPDDAALDVVVLELEWPSDTKFAAAFEQTQADDQLVAVGWGSASEGGFFGCEMKQLPLTVTGHPLCEDSMPGGSGAFFCARGADKFNTCSGDSGSPVFRVSQRQMVAVGFTVGGVGCSPDDIGVYFSLNHLGTVFPEKARSVG